MTYLRGGLVDVHNNTTRSPGDVHNIYDLYGRKSCPALKMHTGIAVRKLAAGE